MILPLDQQLIQTIQFSRENLISQVFETSLL